MNIALWIIQILLGLAFLVFGSMKAFQYEKAKASLPWVKDSSKGLVTFIGVAEILGGLGLVLPNATGMAPVLTPIAAIGLGIVMILASGLHVKRKEYQAIGMNVILLALALFVAIGRI
ncbi:putative membrane protein YphA (DoxX/SURF4 family) [Paenibacillus sp. JGP012]|uniref:DoxX family protein n=1 Tax=Paenibacillus sp. JGP012 TaxID=2735914 RepID=UPI00160FA363|nr:DoxX family protein [Paenibacillus sp. JGP012]MBB6023763.1 putative membrane protein YphA (DoxX/SURF4 family) [Paenibacillus sp. JGP012]